MISVGILACGKIAQVRHLPEYADNPDVRIAGLFDLNAGRARTLAEKYGAKAYESAEALYADPAIDAVSICSSNDTHASLALAALRAGKHVLLEKPMAMNEADCEELAKTAKACGRLLMIDQNQRLAAAHMKARDLIRKGAIGKPITFATSFRHGGPETWSVDPGAGTWFFDRKRAVMGAMADLGIHKTDLIQFLLGQTIVEVSAKLSTLDKRYADGSLIGVDRGVRIEYGKNLTGIRVEADSSGAVTAVRPIGENADGTSLYLDGHIVNGRHGYNSARGTCANWLPSGYRFLTHADGSLRDGSYVTRAAENPFALHRCAAVKCSDARVDEKKKQKNGVSVAVARARMAEQAIAKFDAGCDGVQLSMDVDFVLLGDPEDYRQYRGLEPLFVYDTVHVRHGPLGIRAEINLTRFKWQVRAERVSEADFGALRDASVALASWQLPGGISGDKILPGSLSGRQLDRKSTV